MTTKRNAANNERKCVVEPLENWFRNQRAAWELKKPTYSKSERGWDLEARRKNLDLLIEAKFTSGPFISWFSRLVTSVLTQRVQHFMKRKDRSWCSFSCWAIGTDDEVKNIYQILFDYFTRNFNFWHHYCEDCKVKYVFVVKNDKVIRIPFLKLLDKAQIYSEQTVGKRLPEKREIAEKLMKKYII